MARYAEGTSVSVDQSRREVERTLERFGASTFGYAWDRREETWCFRCRALATGEAGAACRSAGHSTQKEIREYAMLSFRLKERSIRLDVPMPTQREVGTKANLEVRTRERWRAIALIVKAKLQAVEAGVDSIETAFLANVVTGDGRTVGQILLPRMSEAVTAGRLLPAAGETGR